MSGHILMADDEKELADVRELLRKNKKPGFLMPVAFRRMRGLG